MDVKTGKEQQNFLIITSCRWSKYLDYIIVFLPIWTSSQSDYFTHQLEDMQIMSCFKYHCSKHLNIRANLKASTWKRTGSKMASVRPMCMCVCVCMPIDLYQPFLPAGRAPSPVGCESCLWCGPYACAPAHCGVPVCLPAMTRESQGLQPGSTAVWDEDSGCPDQRRSTCMSHSAAKCRYNLTHF